MAQETCNTHPRRSFSEEIELVHDLIANGDRKHALHHCVGALALRPDATQWHAPLRDLLGDAKLRTGLEKEMFFGAHAARAFWLHDTGKLAEAIEIVAQVHAAVPHLGFHRWLSQWLEVGKGVDVAAVPLLQVLLGASSFGVGRIRLLPGERAAAEELVPIARWAMGALPEDGRVALLASAVLRRAGRHREAVFAAERAKPHVPTEQHEVAKGLALRAEGDFDAAFASFERAFAASNDPVHRMEQMRVLADAGRWKDALDAWAKFAERGTPDDENLREREVIEKRARVDAPRPEEPPLDLVRRRALGHGLLAPMTDATANALRQIGGDAALREKGPAGAGAAIRSGKISMAVSGPESASNRLSLALMLTGEADPRRADYSQQGPAFATDDESEWALWKREGDVVVPAMPAPPEEVSDWIERLALREVDGRVAEDSFETSADFLDMWRMAAAEPPPRAPAQHWLAATTHPRMPVIRVCMGPDWVYRWQVAALIGLAFSEEGWRGTRKRDALTAILSATIDWPVAAAIRVAAEIALQEPPAMDEIRRLSIDLASRVADREPDGVVATLLVSLEMIPWVPKEHLERLRAQLTASEAPAAEPEPRRESKRPWWKFWG